MLIKGTIHDLSQLVINLLNEKENKWKIVNTSTDVTLAESSTSYFTDASGGNVTITLPDITADNDRLFYRIVMVVNSNATTITTTSGTQIIGDSTSQQIVIENTGITVQANYNGGSPRYEIVQDSRSAGAAGSIIDGEVSTFAELPDPTLSNGDTYIVQTTTGIIGINRKQAGLYWSNGIQWNRLDVNYQAEKTYYNNADGNLSAVNVKAALDELSNEKQDMWTTANTSTDITLASSLVSYFTDTSAGAVTITLPNVTASNDGFLYRVTMSINSNETIINTTGGTQFIGDATSQTLVKEATGITVQANLALNKYEIIQDSRGGVIVGFDDFSDIDISFDEGTRTLTLTSNNGGNYTFTTFGGKSYGKTVDSIQWTDTEGLIYIYYDENGVLQEDINPDRKRQYELMATSLPVSYIEWDATNKEATFVTDILKTKGMSLRTWTKNFYDLDIYSLQGLNTINDPSAGGVPDGSLDAHAQVGFTTGEILFTDRKYTTPIRVSTGNWTVLYLDNNDLRKEVKTNYMFLQGTDLGLGDPALTYNNGAFPDLVSSGDYVWYFVGINNNVLSEQRLVSFMGQNTYSTENVALDSVNDEIATVEQAFSIKQEFALTHAVLFEYKTSFGNTTKSRIITVQAIAGATGTATAANIPDSLIDGGYTTLHHHIRPIVNTNVDYQITTADGDIFATNGATITLPTVVGEIQRYSISNKDGSLITINALDANILGQTSQQLSQRYDSVTCFTDGIEWFME